MLRGKEGSHTHNAKKKPKLYYITNVLTTVFHNSGSINSDKDCCGNTGNIINHNYELIILTRGRRRTVTTTTTRDITHPGTVESGPLSAVAMLSTRH